MPVATDSVALLQMRSFVAALVLLPAVVAARTQATPIMEQAVEEQASVPAGKVVMEVDTCVFGMDIGCRNNCTRVSRGEGPIL